LGNTRKILLKLSHMLRIALILQGGDGKDTPVASSTSSEHRAGHEGKACTANEKRVPAEQATASKPAAVKRGPSQDLDTSTGPGKRPKQV